MARSRPDWTDDPNYLDRADDLLSRAHRLTFAYLRDKDVTTALASTLVGLWTDDLARRTAAVGMRLDSHSGVRSPIEGLYLLAVAPDALIRDVKYAHECRWFERFRPDFLLYQYLPDNMIRQIIIELDGHDFHERTPEQATADKARDRWFAARGIKVLRYTGREVWNDPIACATESLDIHATTPPTLEED